MGMARSGPPLRPNASGSVGMTRAKGRREAKEVNQMTFRTLLLGVGLAVVGTTHAGFGHATAINDSNARSSDATEYRYIGLGSKMKSGLSKVKDAFQRGAHKVNKRMKQTPEDRQKRKLGQLASDPKKKAKAEAYLSGKAKHPVTIGTQGNVIHKPHQTLASKIGAP